MCSASVGAASLRETASAYMTASESVNVSPFRTNALNLKCAPDSSSRTQPGGGSTIGRRQKHVLLSQV
jgi:hypothetical protein